MALFHFHVTQIRRSAGQSAVASAAYRAGENCTVSITARTVITPKNRASLLLTSFSRPTLRRSIQTGKPYGTPGKTPKRRRWRIQRGIFKEAAQFSVRSAPEIAMPRLGQVSFPTGRKTAVQREIFRQKKAQERRRTFCTSSDCNAFMAEKIR